MDPDVYNDASLYLLVSGAVDYGIRHVPRMLSTLRNDTNCSSVDDAVAEEPPHHTDDIPDTPGSPARLLTDVFIAVNVVVFVAQLVSPEVTILGVKVLLLYIIISYTLYLICNDRVLLLILQDNDFINQGEYWRLLTAAFLHGSPIHLILNCSSLASLGPIVEWTCGRERFIIIYLLAAISGNLASYFGSEYSSLGASGKTI